MYIVTNRTTINKGEGYKLIDRFDKIGKIDEMEGFINLEVLSRQKLKDVDEVSIVTRWDSEESFKKWMKSDAFKEAHRHEGGKPSFIIENEISFYEIEITRESIVLK